MTAPGAEMLAGHWAFGLEGHPAVTRALRFSADGRIAGYVHRNERTWQLAGETLTLFSSSGAASSTFNGVCRGVGRLVGVSVTGRPLVLTRDAPPDRGNPWLTADALREEAADHGWTIGRHTYGRPRVFETTAPLSIGNYCSIAEGVQIAIGDHDVQAVTTYPFASLSLFWAGAPLDRDDHVTRGAVAIGSDVWIGASAFIASGVTIGDGAVIGAHAVVRGDVPPYAIVTGNPASVRRFRFPPDIVAALLRIRWWDWPDEAVDRAIPELLSRDLGSFVARHDPGTV